MFLFCLDISLCMFTRFKRPSEVRVLARATLAEVGCYIWYQSIWFTRRNKKVFKTFGKLFSKPSIKYFPKKSLVYFKGYSPKKKPLAKFLRFSPF